ncbi:MAG: RNA pyrophosphohydrolase [Rhodospirillaceae bacterium]|nr:RNA pyrophosphohydrolase [Rhodospirillaceae bacterium]
MTKKLYRPGVGIMLINANRHIFMGRRIGVAVGGWQMPQGGIDEQEDIRSAALRELYEEAGINKVDILEISKRWFSYELPLSMAVDPWRGKYVGQRQKWFAMAYTGRDSEINLDASGHPEFDAWEWMPPARCLQEIISFKKSLYESVFAEFDCWLIP